MIKMMSYCDRHPVRVRENRRIISTGMDFSKNVYAYVLKAPIRIINRTSVDQFRGLSRK